MEVPVEDYPRVMAEATKLGRAWRTGVKYVPPNRLRVTLRGTRRKRGLSDPEHVKQEIYRLLTEAAGKIKTKKIQRTLRKEGYGVTNEMVASARKALGYPPRSDRHVINMPKRPRTGKLRVRPWREIREQQIREAVARVKAKVAIPDDAPCIGCGERHGYDSAGACRGCGARSADAANEAKVAAYDAVRAEVFPEAAAIIPCTWYTDGKHRGCEHKHYVPPEVTAEETLPAPVSLPLPYLRECVREWNDRQRRAIETVDLATDPLVALPEVTEAKPEGA
jgi:hypothetical protein